MTNQEAKKWIEANHFDGDSHGFVDGDAESEAMFQAVKALEKQATSDYASEWIPCSERLPESGKWVLCTIGTREICVLRREGNDVWFDIGDWSYDFDVVTAWMPLPEPFESEVE